MTTKRKQGPDFERENKRSRCRKRSWSVPSPYQGESDAKKKRQGRVSMDLDNLPLLEDEPGAVENEEYVDENEDPLLDSVPVDINPEQLGFLVCAQETLRFLHGRGIPSHHPMLAKLRSRLLRGIGEMAVA